MIPHGVWVGVWRGWFTVGFGVILLWSKALAILDG
jgi:hypothetical protein